MQAKIAEACSSARDLQIDSGAATSGQNIEKLQALAKASNRADEDLYELSLDALDAYRSVSEKKGDQAKNLNNLGHAIFGIDDKCRTYGVELSPGVEANACGYVLLFFSDAQVATDTFSAWPARRDATFQSTREELLRRSLLVESPELRDALINVPHGFDVSDGEQNVMMFYLSLLTADAMCRDAGISKGTGVPGLYGS